MNLDHLSVTLIGPRSCPVCGWALPDDEAGRIGGCPECEKLAMNPAEVFRACAVSVGAEIDHAYVDQLAEYCAQIV